MILNNISENIKVHKGEKGKRKTSQDKWDNEIECSYCFSKAYFSMSISDGKKGRGRIKIYNTDGKEENDLSHQTIALYYCPHCHKFTAINNLK